MQSHFLCVRSLHSHRHLDTPLRKNTPQTNLFRLKYRPSLRTARPPNSISSAKQTLCIEAEAKDTPIQFKSKDSVEMRVQGQFPCGASKNLHAINRYRVLKKSIDAFLHTSSEGYWMLEGDPICRAKLLSFEKVIYPFREKARELGTADIAKKGFGKVRPFRRSQAPATPSQPKAASIRELKTKTPYSIHTSITVRKPRIKIDHFVFGMSQRIAPAEDKVQAYRDFLWKIAYSHGLYVETPPQTILYTFCVGEGNNSSLIKGIMRRRFWWGITTKKQANLLWTQLKENQYFLMQDSCANKITIHVQKPIATMSKYKQIPNEPIQKIFNSVDYENWKMHCLRNQKTEKVMNHLTYQKRINLLSLKPITIIPSPIQTYSHNHLPYNQFIGNKKALFYNITQYCDLLKNKSTDALDLKIIPLTFHLESAAGPQYDKFLLAYNELDARRNKQFKNIWIMKPGENTNRGNGITVCYNLDEIKTRLKSRQKNSDGAYRTFILQKYIQNPFLYNRRKFDIRHFVLVTCFNGVMKVYWYQEGYVRTSSTQYSVRPSYGSQANCIHLTNDAIQKNMPDYGKYEKGNKVSYEEFQRYVMGDGKQKGKKFNFYSQVLPKMREQAQHAFKSTYLQLDPQRKQNNFQLFGLDFMIDADFQPMLIEVNSNPSLQLCCPLISKIIPSLIENTFRLTVDVLFPPPQIWPISKKPFFSEDPLLQNKFSLLFDQEIDGYFIQQLLKGKTQNVKIGLIQQDTQLFQNDQFQTWQDEAK